MSTLKNWSQWREAVFSKNILKKAAKSSLQLTRLKALTDDRGSTSAAVRRDDGTYSIEFNVRKPQTFNILMLQEDISRGQHIEKFSASVWDGSAWRVVAAGSTIGYKRLLKFSDVTARRVRIDIHQCRAEPHLAEAGLFYDRQ